MASSGYYYGDRHGYSQPAAASSFHLCLFLATASLLGAASLYSRCESAVESLVGQLRVAVVLSPLLLLLAAQYWAGRRQRGAGGFTSLLVAPLVGEPSSSWHDQQIRGGDGGAAPSSPWGVALALALVLLLVSYQSCFQDWWFPLVSRRR